MLTYLTNLASSYFIQPQQPQQQQQQQQQQHLQQHLNPNALSLASIATKTDHQTQSAQSLFNPTITPTATTLSPESRLVHPRSSSSLSTPTFSSPNSLLSSTKNPLSPRATQDLISRLDATSPLLPQNLANFITAASLAARVSLRSSAFFIELILESLRYSTTTSLGITRRALISAVGSARAIHYNTSNHSHTTDSNSSYLNVLDHYTNVGIYLVHHVFTMAELLSIAGLDLTHSVISTGFEVSQSSLQKKKKERKTHPPLKKKYNQKTHHANYETGFINQTAQLSVMMLDSIFGSNESSRALSAIIMLVRRELLHDPRFTLSHSSTLTGLISLTKAITAFACLQLATSRRTTASMKMRVVWDATMIAESVSESKSLVNGIDYQLGIQQGRAHGCGSPHDYSLSQQNISDSTPACPPSTRPSPRQSIHKLSESDKSSLVTDLRSSMASRSTTRINLNRFNSFSSAILPTSIDQSSPHHMEAREEIEYELTQILTDGQNSNSNIYSSESAILPGSSTNPDELVPEDVRRALYQVKRSSYSRTQSSSSELASLETTNLPSHPSSATYQVTTLTTQTTRSRTTTTSTSHLSDSTAKIAGDHYFPANTTTNHKTLPPPLPVSASSPNPPFEAYQVHWSTNLPPPVDPFKFTSPRSKVRAMQKRPKPYMQSKQADKKLFHHHSGELSISRPLNRTSHHHKAKSMPSSPHRSYFSPLPKLIKGSLTRSKTHSDIKSIFSDDPYSFVHPLTPIVSSQTPPSSPSVTSEESSMQSDDPSIHIQPYPEHASLPFLSTISQTRHTASDNRIEFEYFGSPDGQRRPHAPPSSSTSPQQSSTSIQTPPCSDFPPQPLVKNLGRFMRYSSAAYGQQFLRIMGIGVDSFNYPNTKKHSANDHAFASHVGLAVDQILLSSFTEPNPVLGNEVLSPLVHYVSIDDESKAVVLTCRGTLGLSDILVDLTCEYEPIAVDGGDPNASYLAHSGMLHSALRLRRESSTVHEVIKQALIDNPSYGLIITGHSLGGGVAALLAVLCSTRTESFLAQIDRQSTPIAHPPISTNYTYGTPAVASLDLSEYTKGLVTTVCNGIDLVPTLSLGVLHDFKSIAVSLHEEESVAIEIVKKVVGLYRPNRGSGRMNSSGTASVDQAHELFEGEEAEPAKQRVTMKPHEMRSGIGENRAAGCNYRDPALEGSVFGKAETTPELGDWLWSLRRTMRAVSDAEKLYPPGEVWHVESYEVFVVREDEASTTNNESSPDSSLPTTTSSTLPKTARTFSFSWKSTSPSRSSHAQPQSGPSSRQEGRRIILRACEDVQARFSEPIFGKTMFHDHIPSQYELVLELLEAAIGPTNLPSPSAPSVLRTRSAS
ncbi:hypothetical protein VP01_2349g1 [Puccinia sorghi]|uniref:sn-1-specific diacylglycerol lipase n=1 Tax=Puccinia sorghi TaxID=27349 RepID=A0A0L6V971_9BASI|nr:hypothetical protein VP01_2349g1 [Puccinia sorghi]